VLGELSQRYISPGWGGFAEYVCARESSMLPKPASLSFEQAATIPQVGALALGGLRHNGGVKPGQKVLINGAGGGGGTSAVQIAKSYGAEVTGVDSTEKRDMLRSIRADHVIDYTKEDFTRNNQRYDLIVDVAAYHSLLRYRRALADGGAYGVIGGSRVRFFRTILIGPLISKFGNRKLGTVGAKPNEGLELLLELLEANKVMPVIDRTYPLGEVPDAFRYFGEGHVKGKVVISI
jgi:NADPH:quinone reductase-like Zn-dependent oxidoreductase